MGRLSKSENRIVIFKHSSSWSGDRCSDLLIKKGYQIEWCYPLEGNPLPEPERYRGAVFFGCRNSVNDPESWITSELRWVEHCLKTDCAYLGICFGGQILAKVLGAKVGKHRDNLSEVGFTEIFPNESVEDNFNFPQKLFQWHNEGFELPANSTLLCSSERFSNQAIQYNSNAYGLQFHPEVNHSVISQWFNINEDFESDGLDPDSRAVNLAYAKQHDDSITDWFDGFIVNWLRG